MPAASHIYLSAGAGDFAHRWRNPAVTELRVSAGTEGTPLISRGKRCSTIRACAATRGCCSADDGEAEDLIQDTLERALARLPQWREGDNPRKWLFSILHNLHVDGLRRKSRRPPHVGLESIGVDQSEPAADGASGRDLDKALRLLPVEQRQVVLLVGLEGPGYAETAEVLGNPGRDGDVAACARPGTAAGAYGLRGGDGTAVRRCGG